MNAMSATPLTRPFGPGIGVELDGRSSANVETAPLVSILEMRDPVLLPKYGPGPPAPAVQLPKSVVGAGFEMAGARDARR